MRIADIIAFLDSQFHPEFQEDYDNAGFLLGDPAAPCSGALVALDLTDAVLDEALGLGLNLIVTHHPFIFSPLRRITPDTAAGRLALRMAKNDLAAYAAHTNLDNLPDGVNGILGQVLGLTDCRILRPLPCQPSPQVGAGMVGALPFPLPTEAFLQQVKAALGLPCLRLSDVASPAVSRVAFCGGAGSFLIPDAIAAGADVYLTGDLKYHDFQRADHQITLVDIGHFESEQFAPQLIYSVISKNFSTFACSISHSGKSFVNYM